MQVVNVKGFYLILYSIAVRTLNAFTPHMVHDQINKVICRRLGNERL